MVKEVSFLSLPKADEILLAPFLFSPIGLCYFEEMRDIALPFRSVRREEIDFSFISFPLFTLADKGESFFFAGRSQEFLLSLVDASLSLSFCESRRGLPLAQVDLMDLFAFPRSARGEPCLFFLSDLPHAFVSEDQALLLSDRFPRSFRHSGGRASFLFLEGRRSPPSPSPWLPGQGNHLPGSWQHSSCVQAFR